MKALVVGASVISGWNLASHLLDRGWTVHGVSRRPAEGLDGMAPILVDVTDREATVHRAHTMIGWALDNAMNMGTTLAVYGTLCRELGRPFVFPGSPIQHAGVTDVSDAALVAEQLEWSATTPAAANHALNIVNGDVFRRRRLWDVLAADLGVEPGPYPGEARPLEHEMRGLEDTWRGIVSRHGLRETELGRLGSWWHTDSDLGRPVETFADMTKSRSLGFHGSAYPVPVDIRDPRTRHFARWTPEQMDLDVLKRPAPVDAPAVSSSMSSALLAYSGIAVKMLIDERHGAHLGNLFMVDYQRDVVLHPHDHPIEEAFYMLEGEVVYIADGVEYTLGVGDVAYAGVGCVHAFENRSGRRTRWLESRVPLPPLHHAYRFNRDWDYLGSRLEDGETAEARR